MNTDCGLCHRNDDGRNPFLNDSDAGGLGCAGCHVNTPTVAGAPDANPLARHHGVRGIATCSACHAPLAPDASVESAAPPYYGRPDTNVTDSCNAPPDYREDWSGDPQRLGLDNDGDGVYDGSDTDCSTIAPNIDVTPLVLEFGAVTTGTLGMQTLTIANSGQALLTVTDMIVSGSIDFRLGASSPAPPFGIAAGASLPVSIEYAPLENGADAGAMDIFSDDPDEAVVTVTLAGSGVPPVAACDLAITPGSIEFGQVEVNTTATLAVMVMNAGGADCQVGLALTGSGDFSLNPATATTFTLPPRGLVEPMVDYLPSDSGDDAGALLVSSNDPDEPEIVVPVVGSGFGGTAAVDIDIRSLRVPGKISLDRDNSFTIRIELRVPKSKRTREP
jgi:hypothetical protein